MRSWQIVAWGEPLERRDYPEPEPRGTEVLLRVDACGVCHSDLHLHEGFFDLGAGERIRVADRGMQLPFTLGHEIAGWVDATGPGVTGFSVGDAVAVYGIIGCGTCASCLAGRDNECRRVPPSSTSS